VSLGGIDVQYDRGDFYPGVFQFMWELSLYSVILNQRLHYILGPEACSVSPGLLDAAYDYEIIGKVRAQASTVGQYCSANIANPENVGLVLKSNNGVRIPSSTYPSSPH
jgi:hypothetical protein